MSSDMNPQCPDPTPCMCGHIKGDHKYGTKACYHKDLGECDCEAYEANPVHATPAEKLISSAKAIQRAVKPTPAAEPKYRCYYCGTDDPKRHGRSDNTVCPLAQPEPTAESADIDLRYEVAKCVAEAILTHDNHKPVDDLMAILATAKAEGRREELERMRGHGNVAFDRYAEDRLNLKGDTPDEA